MGGNENDWIVTVENMEMMQMLLQGFFGALVMLYVLNQKKLLPRRLSSIVSRITFWPTLPISLLNRYGRWYTVIDSNIILGGAPFGFLNIPKKLYDEHNVRGVINMCEEYKGPIRQYNRLGIQELRLPTTDHFEPSVADMRTAIDFIRKHKEQKSNVYIHCRAGHGRSAAIVYVWLLSQQNDPSEVDMKALNIKLSNQRAVRKKIYKQKNVLEFRSWLIGNKKG